MLAKSPNVQAFAFAILSSGLPARARLVALALGLHPNLGHPQLTMPSVPDLCAWTGCAPDFVVRDLATLRTEGWLVDDDRGPNLAILTIPGEVRRAG